MNPAEPLHIWLCECGCVHLETKHHRWTLTPLEFLQRVRNAAQHSDGASNSTSSSRSPVLDSLLHRGSQARRPSHPSGFAEL